MTAKALVSRPKTVGVAPSSVSVFLNAAPFLASPAGDGLYTVTIPQSEITSGTLSYASALGKPIVATPYVHATELLADGRGILVGFDDPQALAEAVIMLLADRARAEDITSRAYAHGRELTWQRLAERALALFAPLSSGVAASSASLLSGSRSSPNDAYLSLLAKPAPAGFAASRRNDLGGSTAKVSARPKVLATFLESR